MSGVIVVILAGLLLPQTAPHPSTREAYRAPAIRPFEPSPGFAGNAAQGDSDEDAYRRPLEAPVPVEAYDRSYEFTPDNTETAYDQGVTSAEIRTDQTAGPLDGRWQIVDAQGRTLYHLILRDPEIGPVEGGWRGGNDSGGAVLDGQTLTLLGAGAVMTLESVGAGWRGTLTVDGRTRPVALTRPD